MEFITRTLDFQFKLCCALFSKLFAWEVFLCFRAFFSVLCFIELAGQFVFCVTRERLILFEENKSIEYEFFIDLCVACQGSDFAYQIYMSINLVT